MDANTLAKMQELMRLKLQDTGIELKDTKPVFPLWSRDNVNALKNLQVKISDIEANYFEEIQNLEKKYMSLFDPVYEERRKIITGEKEHLSDEEKKWNYADECIYEETSVEVEKPQVKKSLPRFWLDSLKATKMLSDMIFDHDEPALEHLTDIRCRIHEQKPYGYTIEFHFSENEFFTNKVLTKTYELICEKDENRPFLLASGQLYKCIGCNIDWKKDKNLNFKITKVKQKNKKTKTTRMVTKEEDQETFFSLFDTPNEDGLKPSIRKLLEKSGDKMDLKKSVNEDEEEDDEVDDELDRIYEMEFDVCRFLKDTFIPKAILYYTGELVDEDYDDDFDEYDDEDEDEDDEAENNEEEDEDDEDFDSDDAKKEKKALKSAPKNNNSKGKSTEPTPSECKQN